MKPVSVLGFAAAFVLASCSDAGPDAGETPPLDPLAFFDGRSEGRGQLHVLFRKTVPVAVSSQGRRNAVGTLQLDQTIREGSKPPRTRRWILRQVQPGVYTGALTEAVGPVQASTRGNTLWIAYPARGVAIRQKLVLQPDGTLRNRLSAYKAGIRVAWLDEVIRKTR